MPRQVSNTPLFGLTLDPVAAGAALHRQLYDRIRELVLGGRLAPGAREQGLLLGYAAVAEPEIETGIETLARALKAPAT